LVRRELVRLVRWSRRQLDRLDRERRIRLPGQHRLDLGHRRGRTLGFPTANLETDAELLPPSGVYAVEASVDCGPWRPAVANLGVRPTFGGAGRFLIEVHLLDFRGDLYGHALSARFIARLRGEQRFSDIDALAAQIGRDVSAARAALGRA
jgi:riboflavin kinase/FMN adenylyltransferase